MDGSEFMRLNLSNLRVMGIADLSDRINLLHEILVLRDNYKKHAPPPPPSPSSPLSPSGTVSSSSSSLRDSPHSSSPPPPVIRVPGVSITRLRDHEEERAAAASNDNVDDGNNNVGTGLCFIFCSSDFSSTPSPHLGLSMAISKT